MNRAKELGKAFWPLLLPGLLLAIGLDGFPYPNPEAGYSDLVISHFPNAMYLRQSLQMGYLPLWSRLLLSGAPFAANPLSGLWYPVGWLELLLPLPLGFNLIAGMHLCWAGLGMALLLQKQGLRQRPALFGGLAFALMPKLFAHYGAGHLSLTYAVPWTPWLLLAAKERGEKKLRWYAQPGLVLGVIFLADVRWAAYAGLLWLAWEVFLGTGSLLQKAKSVRGQLGLAFLIAAPQAIPLLEYTQLSTRASMTVSDIFKFSLPFDRVLRLLYPGFGGFHENILYPGLIVLFLALLAGLMIWGERYIRFWWGVGLAALIFALGENIPGLVLLARLPGFSLLRVPPRSLFLLGLALAALGAWGMDALLAGKPEEKTIRRMRLMLMGFLCLSTMLLVGALYVTGEFQQNFAWGAVVLMLVWLWLEMRWRDRLKDQIWVLAAFVLMVIDLTTVYESLIAFRPSEQVLGERQAVAEYLVEQPGWFRVYSPSYSIPQQTAMLYGLELADGVDPLQLAAYTDYMADAIGVPMDEYGVTLPRIENGDPVTANQEAELDPDRLARLGVGYVVSAFEIEQAQLVLEVVLEGQNIYRNLAYDPEVWEDVERMPNGLALAASGPGVLTMPELAYPGWQVWVDGNRAEMEVVDGLFRAVDLPTGEHEVVFVFRPLSVYIGVGLELAGVLGLAVWQRRVRSR